jgi:transposase
MLSPCSPSPPPIPKETLRAASAIFGRGNFYIQAGEHLDAILGILHVRCSQERDGGFWKVEDISLGMITFFQFMEGLTDVQAADALQTRIDWKFALHLSLLPGMFDKNALCLFRSAVVRDPRGQYEYQALIDQLISYAPSLNERFQDLKSLELVSLVCSVNRLNRIHLAMNQALEALAARFPQWLRTIALPHWYGRYNPTISLFDITILPAQQRFFMEEIELDIRYLLEKVQQDSTREISELNEIRSLKQVWLQQLQTLKPLESDRLELLSPKDCESCSMRGAGGRY